MFRPDTPSSRSRRRLLLFLLALTGSIVGPPIWGQLARGANAAARAEDLPQAPGREATELRCLTCHGVDIVGQQRLSATAWAREVEKMIGWGAVVGAAEKEDIVKYLSAQFGATSASPSEGKEDPAAALLPRCLVCHDMRLIEEQRLAAAGWAREIDKMIAWGASLNESERDRLSEYLSKRFGAAARDR